MDRPAALPVNDAPNWAESRFGVTQDRFEMRILRDVLGCQHLGVSYLRFGPGWRSSVGHRHPAGEEVYVLVEGRARMKIEREVITLEAPSAVRVRGEQRRAIRPLGGAPAVFIVAGYPIEDPDETELIPNFWPADE